MLRDYITFMGEKPDDFTGSDEDWETYYIYINVMNSLTAMRNMCKDKCGDHYFYTICKAQATISALLEETGRRDRFMKWQMRDEMKEMEDAFEKSIVEGIKKHNSHDGIMSQQRLNNQEKGKNKMGRIIDADELLRKLEEHFNKKEQDAKFTGDREIGVSWNDAIYYIKNEPEISAISQIKNYKQGVIDTVGDCGFARGLQKALDILEGDEW